MIDKRSCDEKIPLLGATVGDFWSWAYSDILNNTDRAVFAEFVVGTALGVTDAPRVEWDAVDLRYGDKTIEVKSAAYVQSWHQEHDPLSQISFDLRPCSRSGSCSMVSITTEIGHFLLWPSPPA